MISRYHLKCPGCEEVFIARLGVEPTSGTRFYLPCPHCRLPIRGSMSGTELENHRIDIECDVLNGSDPELPGTPVVTINPFVPSLYEADSFAPTGAFPTMTLVQILGDDVFTKFESERHTALEAGRAMWPHVRMLFQYYLQGNTQMFSRIAKQKFGLDWDPSTSHERTSVAYQALGTATTMITGSTGTTSERVIGRFSRKHTAAMNRHRDHLLAFRRRGQAAAALERDLFTELNRFVEQHESWEMGLLGRFVGPEEKVAFDELVLYRDEFSTVRDLYQHGFELACKCLWPLVAAQNTVKRGSPDDFGEDHPDSVPVKDRPRSLEKYDTLSNARKIAYVTQVPGWESFADLLNNRRRNTIGHATAHHDLQTGLVVSDHDPSGMTYLEFLSETLGVFEALSTLAQVFRASRVASSPEFGLSD
ncbi:hypothetical protein ACLKOZ_19340 [Arthrobacter sp. R4]|uniref:hypothetical protein n=1 Tax=Arthrobacter sp. R4 TaxID=644417 RepID=UPI003ED9A63D